MPKVGTTRQMMGYFSSSVKRFSGKTTRKHMLELEVILSDGADVIFLAPDNQHD